MSSESRAGAAGGPPRSRLGRGWLSAALAVFMLAGRASAGDWRKLAEGIEYGTFPWVDQGLLHVVRVDPEHAELTAVLASQHGGQARTAAEWAASAKLMVTLNAGMFAADQLSNVGYLRNGQHVNQATWNQKYQSVLAFGPQKPGMPAAAMVDLDAPGAQAQLAGYKTVIQNLRMLKGEGTQVWAPGPRKWSEAAIGIDKRGRLLFLFARSPLSVHDFNERLLKLPLEVTRAMHVEGGPEASLSIHAPGLSLDLSGSYENGFNENDENREQWKIPNVVGVRPR